MLGKSLICVFLLSAVVATCLANATYKVDKYGNLQPADGLNCTRAGFMCDDCSTSVNCFQLPNGTWVKEVVEDCSQTDKTCLASTGICTNETNALCRQSTFVCNQPGIFPDEYDCEKYYLCATKDGQLVSFPYRCDKGFYYDKKHHVCASNKTISCTPAVSPMCSRVSQGPVQDNRRMYHQCRASTGPDGETIFVAHLYNCPSGQVYMLDGCHDTRLPYKVENGLCTAKGSFYTPTCSTYNVCSDVGAAPVLTNCPGGQYFDQRKNVCVEFGCDTLNI